MAEETENKPLKTMAEGILQTNAGTTALIYHLSYSFPGLQGLPSLKSDK